MVAGPLILGCEHDGVAVVEAAGADNVNEFLVATGLVQWNSVRVSYARTLEEAMGEIAEMPPPLY